MISTPVLITGLSIQAIFVIALIVAAWQAVTALAAIPLVIDTLTGGERSGREIRQVLSGTGIRMSAVMFYALMSTLQDYGAVKGWYAERTIDGQVCRERMYALVETAKPC